MPFVMEHLVEVLLFSLTLLLLIWVYFKQAFKYWRNRDVAYVEPVIPFGSLGIPFWDKKGMTIHLKEAYQELKAKGEKFGGCYLGSKPILLAVSPEMVKVILHSAFENFESHGNIFDEKSEPLAAHLLNLDGKRWKDMRVKLTPTFTSGKMKMMFEILSVCGEQLQSYIKDKKWIDVKEVVACFTTDVIGSCAFGLECNSLKNPDAEFRLYGKKAMTVNWKTALRRFGNIVCPSLIRLFKIPLFDRNATDFFMDSIRNIVDYRKEKNISRNDFVQILLNIEESGFTVEEIAAQAFIFFLAGFETSSTTMTFCLYELAHNPEIQDRVRKEIRSVIEKHGGKLTYEGIMEMKYLDQVINETLRKHPPIPVLKRICTKDYQLPNGVIIPKGNIAFLSILGLHRDEEFYPNPDKFDPDRFSEENKAKIPQFAFVPFGEGPRMCIGLRFGMLQTRVGLCSILKDYMIIPHKSLKYPLEYGSKSFVLDTKAAVLLNLDRIEKATN